MGSNKPYRVYQVYTDSVGFLTPSQGKDRICFSFQCPTSTCGEEYIPSYQTQIDLSEQNQNHPIYDCLKCKKNFFVIDPQDVLMQKAEEKNNQTEVRKFAGRNALQLVEIDLPQSELQPGQKDDITFPCQVQGCEGVCYAAYSRKKILSSLEDSVLPYWVQLHCSINQEEHLFKIMFHSLETYESLKNNLVCSRTVKSGATEAGVSNMAGSSAIGQNTFYPYNFGGSGYPNNFGNTVYPGGYPNMAGPSAPGQDPNNTGNFDDPFNPGDQGMSVLSSTGQNTNNFGNPGNFGGYPNMAWPSAAGQIPNNTVYPVDFNNPGYTDYLGGYPNMAGPSAIGQNTFNPYDSGNSGNLNTIPYLHHINCSDNTTCDGLACWSQNPP